MQEIAEEIYVRPIQTSLVRETIRPNVTPQFVMHQQVVPNLGIFSGRVGKVTGVYPNQNETVYKVRFQEQHGQSSLFYREVNLDAHTAVPRRG